MKQRWFKLVLFVFAIGCSHTPSEQTGATLQFPNHPDFKPAPEQGPMPDSVLVVKRTPIEKAKDLSQNN